jgi:hypothetical protein
MKKARQILAWLMLIGGLAGWPLAAFWLAKDEPQFVLGLSFLALIYEGFNALQIAHDS